jgi:hypothetical protein
MGMKNIVDHVEKHDYHSVRFGLTRPGAPFVGDGHKWAPTPEIIKATLTELGGRVIAHDDGPDAMQSFFVCAEFGNAPRFNSV